MKAARRWFLLIAVIFAGSPLAAQEIEVTLLGTGTPRPAIDRFGPSTLIEAGDQLLVFDAGRGAMQRLSQLDILYSDIDAIFLTHFHSDHIVGLPDLWLTGWIMSRRDRPLQIFGPPGTENLVSNLREAFEFDIAIRVSDDLEPFEGSILEVTEIEEGDVYERDGVRVIPFDVDHRPIAPSLGYRIEYADRTVVLSGDTRYSENLIKNAMGVDLLIHEVGASTEEYLEIATEDRLRAYQHHTSPAQAGDVFTQTSPKLAVYSHLVMLPGYESAQLIPDTRQTYDGPLIVGEDLMRFLVGDQVDIVAP